MFPDNATGRKILSLFIRCPNTGCDWTGELREKKVRSPFIHCEFISHSQLSHYFKFLLSPGKGGGYSLPFYIPFLTEKVPLS